MENYKEFLDYCRLRAEDINEWYNDIDLADRIHEMADGSTHVIYYSKAWDLVNMMRLNNCELLDHACEEIRDNGFEFRGDINAYMTSITYYLISNGIRDAYYELIEPKALAK